MEKQIKAFINEYNRLIKKYEDNRTITVKSFMNWNYVEDELEAIEFYGGKNYAQMMLHNEGAIPADEVDAWK